MQLFVNKELIYRTLIVFQYFSLSYFDAKIFVPCILLSGTLKFYLVRQTIEGVKILSWWMLFIFFIVVYLLNIQNLNVAVPLGTSLVFAIVLFFLIVPKNMECRYFAVIAFSLGIVCLYVPAIIEVVLKNSSILGLYGRLQALTGDTSLLTSHLSIYLGFAAVTLICQPYSLRPTTRLIVMGLGIASLLCAVVLLGKFIIVAIMLILFFYKKSLFILTLLVFPLLKLYDAGRYMELLSLYENFLQRWEDLFTNPAGRLHLWEEGYAVLGNNVSGYKKILGDFGYNSFHNILLDSWRFGGIFLAFFVFLFLVLELYKAAHRFQSKDLERKFFATLTIYLLLALQIEVYFEAMYKILFLLPCIFSIRVKLYGNYMNENKGLKYAKN